MTAAVPETKSNALIDEMNLLILQKEVDSFTIKRIKKDIEALKKHNHVDALVIQSGLFVLDRDFKSAFDEAKKLLRQWPNYEWVVINAEVTLNRIGRFIDLAQEIINSALKAQSDKKLLWLGLKTAYISGLFLHAVPIAERLNRLGEAVSDDEVKAMNQQLIDSGVTHEHTQQIAKFAYATLRHYKDGMFLGRAIQIEPEWVTDEFNDSWLANRVLIPMRHENEIDDIVALNDAVCVGLADEKFRGNPALNRFLIDFVLEDRSEAKPE